MHLLSTRSALYPCLPNGKHTRSSAPAQHCIHACQMVSTPVQVHAFQMVSTPAQAHQLMPAKCPLKCTRSALYPCLPNGKHTAEVHALSIVAMAGAPAQAHPLRSSAPAQHCIHACQMVSTPAHAHPWFLISRWREMSNHIYIYIELFFTYTYTYHKRY